MTTDIPFDRNQYLDAEEFARHLACPNALAFEYEQQAGLVPAPDTVFEQKPFWSRQTVAEAVQIRTNAIRAAWGHPPITDLPEQAPPPDNDGMRW